MSETLEQYKERGRFAQARERDAQRSVRFHITYTKGGRTEVGRVVIADDRMISAGALRDRAMRSAAFRFGVARSAVKSAVRVGG